MLNAVPLAARDADEAAKVMESRFVIAQLLTSTGETESAIAELRAVRPLLAAAYGPGVGAGPQPARTPRQPVRPPTAAGRGNLASRIGRRVT